MTKGEVETGAARWQAAPQVVQSIRRCSLERASVIGRATESTGQVVIRMAEKSDKLRGFTGRITTLAVRIHAEYFAEASLPELALTRAQRTTG
jgi:hypothetical protein